MKSSFSNIILLEEAIAEQDPQPTLQRNHTGGLVRTLTRILIASAKGAHLQQVEQKIVEQVKGLQDVKTFALPEIVSIRGAVEEVVIVGGDEVQDGPRVPDGVRGFYAEAASRVVRHGPVATAVCDE